MSNVVPWIYEENGIYWGMDSKGNWIETSPPSQEDNPNPYIDPNIEGVIFGYNLSGDIISMTYTPPNYSNIIGALPNTPIDTDVLISSVNDKKPLPDVLKKNTENTNSRLDKQNKLLEQQNQILNAQAKAQIENNKLIASLTASVSSLAKNDTDLKQLKKESMSQSISKNVKFSNKLNIELTGEFPKDPKNISLMDKSNGTTNYSLLSSDGKQIKPMEEKIREKAEKRIETEQMNKTDFGTAIDEFLGSDDLIPFEDIMNIAINEIGLLNEGIYQNPQDIKSYMESKIIKA